MKRKDGRMRTDAGAKEAEKKAKPKFQTRAMLEAEVKRLKDERRVGLRLLALVAIELCDLVFTPKIRGAGPSARCSTRFGNTICARESGHEGPHKEDMAMPSPYAHEAASPSRCGKRFDLASLCILERGHEGEHEDFVRCIEGQAIGRRCVHASNHPGPHEYSKGA